MTDILEKPETEELWLVMKRGLYYRPNDRGYTGLKEHAGRYTYEEAKKRECSISGVSIIREPEAPDISPNCYEDYARQYLEKKLTEANAEIDRLEAALAAEKEKCAQVADKMAERARTLMTTDPIDKLESKNVAEVATELAILAAMLAQALRIAAAIRKLT